MFKELSKVKTALRTEMLLCWAVVKCDPSVLVGHLLYPEEASKTSKRRLH
jgi:hypothetical protein